jgi:20S proteasome alpha/beta subunit
MLNKVAKLVLFALQLGVILLAEIANGVVAISPPWTWDVQPSSQESSFYLDLPPTVFAPNGRLYSIESAVRACGAESSNTVIAVMCRDGVVVVSTVQKSPYMDLKYNYIENGELEDGHLPNRLVIEGTGNSLAYDVTPIVRPPFSGVMFPSPFSGRQGAIIGITVGNAVDSQVARRKLLRFGEYSRAFQGDSYYDIGSVARQLADQQQTLTQQGGTGRLLATIILLASESEIWRIDLTGQYWKCHAAFIGQQADIVEQLLAEKLAQSTSKKNVIERNFWTSFLQTRIVDDVQPYANPQLLTSSLAKMSLEESVSLCATCLIEALQKRTDDAPNQISNFPELQALVIKRSNQLQYYTSSALMQLIGTTNNTDQ